MKENPPRLIVLCWLFLLVAIFSLELKISVKYSQIFADKKITITENLKLGERIFLLPAKKGFVCFED